MLAVSLEIEKPFLEVCLALGAGFIGALGVYWSATFASDSAALAEQLRFTGVFALSALCISWSSFRLYRQLKLDF
jgi:hypothetical protein